MIRWHLLHPAAVHFPVALLTLGLAVNAAAALRKGPPWLAEAGAWLLWLGTASVWAALGLGLLAEKFAPHVPAAWEALAEHEEAAWWAAGLFTALSLARWRLKDARRGLVAAGWAVALCALARTAYLGGELVFKYGMGLVSEEAVQEPLDK